VRSGKVDGQRPRYGRRRPPSWSTRPTGSRSRPSTRPDRAAARRRDGHRCGRRPSLAPFRGRGHHVERLAAAGLVGLAFTNSPAALAPWGGRWPIYGTNPIAFACPRAGASPLVVDLSLSKVARGRIMVAAQKGESIPEGWAVDADGRPTTDAKAALAGTMLPLGDAKGPPWPDGGTAGGGLTGGTTAGRRARSSP
jgi:(2R)-3-sulfolactate dehydrogenase (NADP+)